MSTAAGSGAGLRVTNLKVCRFAVTIRPASLPNQQQWQRESRSMKPDMRNIVTVSKEDTGSRQRVVIRHRTFPEIEIESGSMVEGLEALLSALKQFGDWTKDEWHSSALGQAVVDVETALTLLAPSGHGRRIYFEPRHADRGYPVERRQRERRSSGRSNSAVTKSLTL
jgi:hypothetical protein